MEKSKNDKTGTLGMSTANKNTTISTLLITAALTMITVIGAFAVFIIDKREIGLLFYIVIGLAFFCFVVSIFLGGQGLSGKGADKSPNPFFDWQAKMALMGVILFCISIFLGKEKPDELEKKVDMLEKDIIKIETLDDIRDNEILELKDRINNLRKQIEELRNDTVPNRVGGSATTK